MVKHYREGGTGAKITRTFGVVTILREKHVMPVDRPKIKRLISSDDAGSEGSQSSCAKQSSRKPPKKKTVFARYIVNSDTSSSSGEASDESSSSDNESYSSCSDEEPSPPPPKRAKNQKSKKSSVSEIEKQDEEYVVEKIVDMKKDKEGKRYYLIKWLNYPNTQNTWEPKEHLEKCQDLIDAFLEDRSCKKSNKRATNSEEQENVHATKKIQNGLIHKNGNRNGNPSNIKHAMASSAQKVVGIDVPSLSTECSNIKDQIQIPLHEDVQQLSEKMEPVADKYISIPHTVNLFYFRIVDDDQMNWIYIDVSQPIDDHDTTYRCVVTEDLTGKQPKWIYGATTAMNGEKFCLVQFEGYNYIEVIPPENLFLKFPTFRKYFEVICPHLFSKNSH